MAVAVHIVGDTSYAAVHALQEQLVAWRADGRIPDVILMLEHEPTITVGRAKGAMQHVLDSTGLQVVPISRGGDATLHAPGQLVVYPIIGLVGARRDVLLHLRSMEDAVLQLLATLGLPATRDPRNTGVWLPSASGPQKVCAMGIAVRRWVTWHGLALNVHIDLDWYRRIEPCGFANDTVTSVASHLSPAPSVADLVPHLAALLCRHLDVPMHGPVLRTYDTAHETLRALLDESVGGVTLRRRTE